MRGYPDEVLAQGWSIGFACVCTVTVRRTKKIILPTLECVYGVRFHSLFCSLSFYIFIMYHIFSWFQRSKFHLLLGYYCRGRATVDCW